jgi:hypothetical protein
MVYARCYEVGDQAMDGSGWSNPPTESQKAGFTALSVSSPSKIFDYFRRGHLDSRILASSAIPFEIEYMSDRAYISISNSNLLTKSNPFRKK